MFFGAGTLRLTVYYHEAPKKPPPLSHLIKEEADGTLPALKGLIYDKQSMFYYPPDPGPPRSKPKPGLVSFRSVADVILFKVTMDQRLQHSNDKTENHRPMNSVKPNRHTILPQVKKRSNKSKHAKQ